ncbi:hypothetical protein [Shewanella waksmanii]|uniref:hypothetical protein n=1 Tax=Shewanella waksmanii TaxID=213783 RepID=UPI003736C691
MPYIPSQLPRRYFSRHYRLSLSSIAKVSALSAALACTSIVTQAETAPQVAKTAPLVTQNQLQNGDPLQGAWQLQQGKYVDDKGQWHDYADLHLQAIKVLADGYFSFTTIKQAPANKGIAADVPKPEFWAAGAGKYKVTATHYTEFLSINSFGAQQGQAFSFEYRIEKLADKTLLHTKRIEEGELKEVEVWLKQ